MNVGLDVVSVVKKKIKNIVLCSVGVLVVKKG